MRFAQFIPVLFFAIAALGVPAHGEEAPPVRVDFAYATRSVFRGIERASDCLQANLELTRVDLRGGLRATQPFASGAREVELHGGYRWIASDQLSLEASVAHVWFGDVPGGGVNRSLEAGLAAALAPVGGFTPSLAYHRDFRFRADTVELSAARSVALAKWGAFLEFNLFTGWVTGTDWRPAAIGPRRRDSYHYWGGEVTLPYRIGAHATVMAGLHVAGNGGRSALNGPFGRPGEFLGWATLGVSLDF